MYDLLIIGGGPAGLSAAMTARNRNLSVCVICGGAADSALYKAGHVTNYPGVPDVSGPALLETMTQQARALGADILRERALSAMPMGKTFGVSAGKEFAEGRALLLATGIAQRGTFPGEAEFLGRGVSYCATCDGMLYRGKRAAVIGLAADAPELGQYLSGNVLPSGLRGWTLVRVDGLSLGWAKGDGTQLKNHYPKALRRPV